MKLSFSIFSPIFLTKKFSPSFINLISVIGINSDNTPVILKSTLFDKSPFSNPKIVSLSLKFWALSILTPTPVHPKNWFTDFDVYSICVLAPLITVPVVPNPTVESTLIIEEPTDTGSITFVLPGTVNTPSIKSRSLNPTNNAIL